MIVSSILHIIKLRLREIDKLFQKIFQLVSSRTLVFWFQIPCSLDSNTDTTHVSHICRSGKRQTITTNISQTHSFSMPAASAPASVFFHFRNIILWGFPSLIPALSFQLLRSWFSLSPTYQLYFFLCNGINDININQNKRKKEEFTGNPAILVSQQFSFLCFSFQGLTICIYPYIILTYL